jgi:hypothetical protein
VAAGGKDIYERFELEVRTPKRRLLLDAFLPPPETLESTVTPPAPPPVPEEAVGEFRLGVRRDEEEEPAPRPAPRSKRRGAAARKREGPKSLQEEIDEFMKRDQTALAPETEPEPAPKAAPDRKADPDTEPKS